MTASQTIVVTGDCGNLGHSLPAELSRRGDSVVAVDREPAKLSVAIAPLVGGGRHQGIAEAHLVDPGAAERTVATALAR